MAKASPAISAQNAGEFSPRLFGRIDLAGYPSGAKRLENFLPLVQGPIEKRAGTRYVAAVKDSAKRGWLVPFIRSRSISYVIEFADSVCRFYFNRGQVLSSSTPYELASPYDEAALTLPTGEFALDFVQTGDVLYLTDRRGVLAPRRLSRTSSTSWAFSTLDPDTGPWRLLNATDTTLYASAATGSITLTASAALFTAGHVGALVRIEQETLEAVPPWATNTSYSIGDYVRSEGLQYVAKSGGTSGTTIPSHTSGTASDGKVDWTFSSLGYGVARITAVASGTSATATVLKAMPQTVIGSVNATKFWQLGAWAPDVGYPETVTFFRERLAFGQGQDIHLSQSADFENFAPDVTGERTPESAVTVTLQSNEANGIQGFAEAENLIVLTEGAEFSVSSLTTSDPFGPGNVKVSKQTSYGASPAKAHRVGEAVLFTTPSQRKIRELRYNIEVDNLTARDVTVRADHVIAPGVAQSVFVSEPSPMLLAVRADGQIAAFTYDRDQEVLAWSRILIGGSVSGGADHGVVESVTVIPSPNGDRDDVWMIVRRTVNGATARYVEYVSDPYDEADGLAAACYSDSALVYSGSATTTLSGLGHLEGQTVTVLANGVVHPDRVVSSGAISLQTSVTEAVVGLAFDAVYRTLDLEGGAADGTAQGKIRRITDVVMRVADTLGGEAGPTFDDLDLIPDLNYRAPATLMGSGPPLVTGDVKLEWPGGWDTKAEICFRHRDPLPATISGVYPQVVVQEAR